jgi:hypothetical protein
MSGSMRGRRKRAVTYCACVLLYRVPRELPPLLLTRFVRSAQSQIPFFRRTHVSALNFCISLFR